MTCDKQSSHVLLRREISVGLFLKEKKEKKEKKQQFCQKKQFSHKKMKPVT